MKLLTFPNFNVWVCINNFISHFLGRMITYTCSIDRCLPMTALYLPFVLSLLWNKGRNSYTLRPKIYAHGLRFIIFLCGLLTRPPPPDKIEIAGIPQTVFSDAFSWMKSFIVWLKFQWSVFLRVQLTPSIGLDNDLVLNRRQAIIWTNADLMLVPIFAKKGVFFQGEARIREIKKKGSFCRHESAKFWKRVKFGMYLVPFVCSAWLNAYA